MGYMFSGVSQWGPTHTARHYTLLPLLLTSLKNLLVHPIAKVTIYLSHRHEEIKMVLT